VWRRTEGTLSIHSITTRRREVFYWLTVSFTFALGTAAGDLTADQLGLGFLGSIALFAAAMAAVALGCWRFHLNGVAGFWFAYILTRPLGASVADWLSKPATHGGVGFGDGPLAAALLTAIVVAVAGAFVRRVTTSRTPCGCTSSLSSCRQRRCWRSCVHCGRRCGADWCGWCS
jgi:uncharacterized membrane-anchored protein